LRLLRSLPVICELGTLGDGDSQVITIIVTVRQ
jgi:hypothetical protein